MTTPTFRAPSAPASQPSASRADIIQVDTALQSMRDSGFDLTAAAGEPIDNSIEAGASLIRVLTQYGGKNLTQYGGKNQSIDEIAFADNGVGVDPGIVAHVLSMGYSTRYGQRGSLGRFGVGVKLAGLSLGRRIDIYTKQAGSPAIWHSYIDLKEIADKKQTYIVAEEAVGWPAEYKDAMTAADGRPFDSGTLIIFGKIDRLASGGHYGTSLNDKIHDLRAFIARVYRKFLDHGLVIELNGQKVTLLDPLFRLDNPRIIDWYKPADPRGTIVDEDDIVIANGQKIHVTVTTAPVEFRWKEGDGGNRDSQGREIREYQIADSAGKISMVRNGREINYDIVPRLLPQGIDKVDRYIGIEVTFPAVLDEFFQVRNVKRGAAPVDKLREELRKWLERPVKKARKDIREHWGEVKLQEAAKEREHAEAEAAAARANQTAPKGQAGRDETDEEKERVIRELLADLGVTEGTPEADEIRQEITEKPMVLVDGGWAGKEIFEVTHLNGKAIVRLNHRHPFIRDIYDELKAAGNGTGEDMSAEELAEELVDLVRKTKRGLDVLFLAYAKAENMHPDPSVFDDLRTYWGMFTQSYLREIPTED